MPRISVSFRWYGSVIPTESSIVGLVFLIVGMVNWLNFVGFARSWSHIMLPWSSVDILMLFPPYKRGKRSLRSKVNVLALSVVVLAVGEISGLSFQWFPEELPFRRPHAVLRLWLLQL